MQSVKFANLHTFFWSNFSFIWTKCKQRKSSDSVRRQEIRIRKNPVTCIFYDSETTLKTTWREYILLLHLLNIEFFGYSFYKSHSSLSSWVSPIVTGGSAFSQLVHPQKSVHDFFHYFLLKNDKYWQITNFVSNINLNTFTYMKNVSMSHRL